MIRESAGRVIALYISQIKEPYRIKKAEIRCDQNGIIDDKFYAKESNRSILITSQDSYKLLEKESILVPHGLLGENILLDYNPYNLEIGSRLKIGNVVLEITQNCTICNHLSAIDKRIPKLLKTDRGIFAKVVESGKIDEGNDVELIK